MTDTPNTGICMGSWKWISFCSYGLSWPKFPESKSQKWAGFLKEDRRSFMFQELFIGSIYLGILIPITRETLNKSQNQTLYRFLYIASS